MGRWKDDGTGKPVYDANDSGPDQIAGMPQGGPSAGPASNATPSVGQTPAGGWGDIAKQGQMGQPNGGSDFSMQPGQAAPWMERAKGEWGQGDQSQVMPASGSGAGFAMAGGAQDNSGGLWGAVNQTPAGIGAEQSSGGGILQQLYNRMMQGHGQPKLSTSGIGGQMVSNGWGGMRPYDPNFTGIE